LLGKASWSIILKDLKAAVTYEVTYIIKPTIDEEAADRVCASVEEFIKSQAGTIQSTDKKGRRRLAYEVKKMKDGYYVTTVFAIQPDKVAAIRRMMTLSEDITRSLIVIYQPEEYVAESAGTYSRE
jgi:small subunit ribosomal protein S6